VIQFILQWPKSVTKALPLPLAYRLVGTNHNRNSGVPTLPVPSRWHKAISHHISHHEHEVLSSVYNLERKDSICHSSPRPGHLIYQRYDTSENEKVEKQHVCSPEQILRHRAFDLHGETDAICGEGVISHESGDLGFVGE